MISAAQAKGLEKGSVDSIYLREGTKEYEDFERRNGFDKSINPANGLLMKQHTL